MVEVLAQARFRPTAKEDRIVLFMDELSGYYQMAPDSDFVFLPFPKRAFVHQVYQSQAAPGLTVNKSYFMKVWRTNPVCSRVKLRRHLRFACVTTASITGSGNWNSRPARSVQP
jgi:hypothetical protein